MKPNPIEKRAPDQEQKKSKPIPLEQVVKNDTSTDNVSLPEVSNEKVESELLFSQNGLATYYANNFQGKKTAYGERYDKNKYTAAHLTLPYNTIVKVTSLNNNKSVIVRINDRGPRGANRIIDLSRVAAEEIDLVRKGVEKVKVEVFKEP